MEKEKCALVREMEVRKKKVFDVNLEPVSILVGLVITLIGRTDSKKKKKNVANKNVNSRRNQKKKIKKNRQDVDQ